MSEYQDQIVARRKAATKRAKERRSMVHPIRKCEDCGKAIEPDDRGYDPVLCWECLSAVNGNQRAGRPPRLTVSKGDAA